MGAQRSPQVSVEPGVLRIIEALVAAKHLETKDSAGLSVAAFGSLEELAPRRGFPGKAACVLTQVLYAVWFALFDLLCAVANLTRRIHTAGEACGQSMYRLVWYMHSTWSRRQVAAVGDVLKF